MYGGLTLLAGEKGVTLFTVSRLFEDSVRVFARYVRISMIIRMMHVHLLLAMALHRVRNSCTFLDGRRFT